MTHETLSECTIKVINRSTSKIEFGRRVPSCMLPSEIVSLSTLLIRVIQIRTLLLNSCLMIAEITNNYGNIRSFKSFKWLGQVGEYKGFCRFESVDYGLRALYMLINRYITYYRLTDVPSILRRYAPPSENLTSEYISHVIDFLSKADYGCSRLKSHDERIPFICSAIVLHECGKVVEPVRFINALAL